MSLQFFRDDVPGGHHIDPIATAGSIESLSLDEGTRLCNNGRVSHSRVSGKELEVDGFLPMSRANFVLDFIALAMAAIIPMMLLSLFLVRSRKNFDLHRRIQIVLGVVLGLAILVFELDMRMNGWRQYAEPSPYYQTLVMPALFVHLCFAIPTLVLWILTISMALRHHIAASASAYRLQHKRWGRYSAYAMIGTTVTGWMFFWLAFMA